MSECTTRPELHPASARVTRLREVALNRGDALASRNPSMVSFERDLYGGEALMQTADDCFWVRRRGKAVANILQNATVQIGPDELLVGRLYLGEPTAEEAERLEEAQRYLAAQPKYFGQAGHMSVDIPKLLAKGARGIQQDIEQHRSELDPANPDHAEKTAFYDAAHIALEGLCAYAEHHAEAAERLAAEATDEARKQELLQIAERCRRVPAHPARTYAEALQAVHFVNSTIHWAQGSGLICPGHPDRWLWPYYERDIAAGRLSPEQAQELLDCSNILINETIARGLAIGLMVAGRGPDDRDVTNELSYMCLQSIRNVGLSYPGVGICWNEDTPADLLACGCEILAERGANPAIFNDAVISQALLNAGVTPQEACEFQNSTCVEISPAGASNVWVASPYFNLCQILLDLLHDVACGEVQAATFGDLLPAYCDRLGAAIKEAVGGQNANRISTIRHRNFPLLSPFVRDCIERGLDIDCGGARYNWIECSFVGLANLVDSLAVIREFLYGYSPPSPPTPLPQGEGRTATAASPPAPLPQGEGRTATAASPPASPTPSERVPATGSGENGNGHRLESLCHAVTSYRSGSARTATAPSPPALTGEVRALLDVLAADFAGHEDLRQRFLTQVPSYGNDEPAVDELAVMIADFVAAECAKYDVVLGGGFKPGFFCWVMHERLGSETGATPDGRKAGVPFADGAGPAQGRERNGPTAAVKSTTCWDHTPMLGGLVLNLKFSKKALESDESRGKLAELIKTYMRLGGMEVQINVVSREALVAAKARPEEYRDLVVRVAGYTDYFTNLSAAMQDEIIARTEFDKV